MQKGPGGEREEGCFVSKRKAKVIHEPIYGADIYFLLGGTAGELRQYFVARHGSSPDFPDCTAGLVHATIEEKKQNYVFYLWLETFSHDIADWGNLAHECLHLTFAILDKIGMEVHESSEEAYAYLHEYLVKESLKILHGFKGKKQ